MKSIKGYILILLALIAVSCDDKTVDQSIDPPAPLDTIVPDTIYTFTSNNFFLDFYYQHYKIIFTHIDSATFCKDTLPSDTTSVEYFDVLTRNQFAPGWRDCDPTLFAPDKQGTTYQTLYQLQLDTLLKEHNLKYW